jgi:probable F420-dependent oxidoreductase
VRFGVTLPQFGPFAVGPEVTARIARVAVLADRLGYDVLWTAEHLIFPYQLRTPYPYAKSFPFPVTHPMLEVMTTLSYCAALTRRIRLSSQVMILPYRHPILAAKELATLDVLSGGRVMVGVASGWLAEEFEMLGVPFRERGRRMDEYLDALVALWTEEHVTFRGRFVRIEDAAFFPKPVQRPHPPLWIGGGEAAFERIVRVGTGWIAAPRASLDELARDIAALRRLAETRGRDPATIGVASGGLARGVDELLDRLPALERAGVTITSVSTLFWTPDFERALELMEEFAGRAGLPRADGGS